VGGRVQEKGCFATKVSC